MTDDLVKHLRSGDVSIKMPDGSIQYVNHVAADRIEQLEAALHLIAEHPVDDSKQWEVGCKEMKKVARAALGEKKDG